MPPEVRTLLTTAPSVEVARELVDTVVGERLAACGTLLPGAESIYRWQGRIERSPETVVLLKTSADRAEALSARVAELHPYEVPEALILEVGAGHVPYLEWVEEETRSRGTTGADGP